jgi:hypothetical protein
MRLNVSPSVYLALCGLVKDALEVESDAQALMQQAAQELASAAAASADEIPEEVMERVDAIIEMRDAATAPRSKSAA